LHIIQQEIIAVTTNKATDAHEKAKGGSALDYYLAEYGHDAITTVTVSTMELKELYLRMENPPSKRPMLAPTEAPIATPSLNRVKHSPIQKFYINQSGFKNKLPL
jgi:hypothetical protein